MRHFLAKPVHYTAIQWTGENGDELQALLKNDGYVKGRYVEIGVVHHGKPSLQNAHIGDWLFHNREQGWHVVKENDIAKFYDETFPSKTVEYPECSL